MNKIKFYNSGGALDTCLECGCAVRCDLVDRHADKAHNGTAIYVNERSVRK